MIKLCIMMELTTASSMLPEKNPNEILVLNADSYIQEDNISRLR